MMMAMVLLIRGSRLAWRVMAGVVMMMMMMVMMMLMLAVVVILVGRAAISSSLRISHLHISACLWDFFILV